MTLWAPMVASGWRLSADHFAPVHEEPVRERLAVDPGAARKLPDRLQQLRLRARAQEPVDAIEGGRLLGRRPRCEARRPGVDRLEAPDRLFELEPPEARRAFDEPGRAIDGERRVAALEHGKRRLQRIAVAVVEGQRREGRAFAVDEPAAGFVERHEFEAFARDDVERDLEEPGGDLERAVRRVAGRRSFRPHPVERQNDARPARGGSRRAVQPARPEAGEAGADDGVPDRHGLPLPGTMNPRSLGNVDDRFRPGGAREAIASTAT